MSDTIDLLDAIGRDASLRHASAVELTGVLEQVQASTALKAAVALGDSTQLSKEFGNREDPPPPNITHMPAEEPKEGEDAPQAPPVPDQSQGVLRH